MEEPSFKIPKPNELPCVMPWTMYPMVHVNTWKVIEFLMTELEPVHLEDLDPDGRDCAICKEEFRVSADPKLSHTPVKTVSCGHIFGKPCIIKWLDPLCYWGSTEGQESVIHDLNPSTIKAGNTTCPTCQRIFFFEPYREPMDSLASRLWLWDKAYAYAGVARTRMEEHSRKILWGFIEYCRSINEFKISRNVGLQLIRRSEILLTNFAGRLKETGLSQAQECLRVSLLALGNYNLRETVFESQDDIDFTDLFRRKDYPDEENDGGGDEHYDSEKGAEEDEGEEDEVEDEIEDEEANQQHPEDS